MEKNNKYIGKFIKDGFGSTLFVMPDPKEPKLYIIKKTGLREYKLKTKEYIKFNEESWSSATAACFAENHIYIACSDGNIYKIAPKVGSKAKIFSSNWKNVKYLLYHGDTMYIFNEHLWHMNISTGNYFCNSNIDWSETRCAAIADTGCWIATSKLHRGDLSTGKFEIMNGDVWNYTSHLYCSGNIMYAACRELYIVYGDGRSELIEVDWGSGRGAFRGQNILSICGINNKLYGIWDSGNLWEIDLE